jgi:hypothetical protein
VLQFGIWFWVGFIAFVLAMLALDLGVFHRKAHAVKPREAGIWVSIWVSLAMLFAAGVWVLQGRENALMFLTGFFVASVAPLRDVMVRNAAPPGTIGTAFGMKVLAWSQNLTPEACQDSGASYASREELLGESDFVSIHLQLSDRTRGLIGSGELALMKPSAFLINTSRGPIVDEAALVDALRSGRIAGAGIDVFDIEPLPLDHPFRGLDNAQLSPHLGYVTEDTFRLFYSQTVEAVRAWLDGAPVRLIEPPK